MTAATAAILAIRQLDDGAFEYASDPIHHGFPHAYATTMAAWACCEAEGMLPELHDRTAAIRRKATRWLSDHYLKPFSTDASAIGAVSGLVEQTLWVLERSRRLDERATRTRGEEQVADVLANQLLRSCLTKAAPYQACRGENGKVPHCRDTQQRYVMLWLPWASLAALDLMNLPPSSLRSGSSQLETLVSKLLRELASRASMNVASSKFDTAEHLFAMSEALRMM